MELLDPDSPVDDQRYHATHLAGAGPHPDQLLLVEHQVLKIEGHIAHRNPHGSAGSTFPQHLNAPPEAVGDPGAIEHHVRAQAFGHLPDDRNRIRRGVVDRLIAHLAGIGETIAPPHHDDPAGAGCSRRIGRQKTNRPWPEDDDIVPRSDLAPVGGVQGDGGRVENGPFGETQAVGKPEDRLDAVHDVLGEGTLPVVSVLAVDGHVPVVLTQVVAPLDTGPAETTGVVRGAGHPVTDGPT
jgi:hypothetical protein